MASNEPSAAAACLLDCLRLARARLRRKSLLAFGPGPWAAATECSGIPGHRWPPLPPRRPSPNTGCSAQFQHGPRAVRPSLNAGGQESDLPPGHIVVMSIESMAPDAPGGLHQDAWASWLAEASSTLLGKVNELQLTPEMVRVRAFLEGTMNIARQNLDKAGV